MQLDKIIIALRERNSWEAMDLGVKLMYAMWPLILLPWLILMSAVLVISLFVQWQGYGYLALFFMWWLKPVYESLLLYILSRSVFGEYLSTGDVYSSAGQWLKTGWRSWLFIWRISPSRSFNMSVHLLEGLKGVLRKKRLTSLHQVIGLNAYAVTVMGLFFEIVLALTLFSLIAYLAPDIAGDSSNVSRGDAGAAQASQELIWLIIAACVYGVTLFILEPFYVAAGFMLYLNRRTQLEGWDIELDFKKMVQRIHRQTGLLDEPAGAHTKSDDHV